MVSCHFKSGFNDGLKDIYVVISLLPPEFASNSRKFWEEEDYYEAKEVGSNLVIHLIEQVLPPDCAIFKKSNEVSKAHMKPLFVAAKVGDLVKESDNRWRCNCESNGEKLVRLASPHHVNYRLLQEIIQFQRNDLLRPQGWVPH